MLTWYLESYLFATLIPFVASVSNYRNKQKSDLTDYAWFKDHPVNHFFHLHLQNKHYMSKLILRIKLALLLTKTKKR